MLDRFKDIEEKFEEIERRISDPEVISNQQLYQELIQQHAELKEGVDLYRRYSKVESEMADAKELLTDSDMKEIAESEIKQLTKESTELQEALLIFLLPKDPNDKKNAVVEIRQGTGGDEAALFAADLFRMYSKYAETKGWSVEVISQNDTGIGGLKEISFIVSGAMAYSRLKFESGTHRVQRVPETESSGRIHTSAATVAILPEAADVDVSIDTKDLRIDTYRASGAGGQHVNKTSSAVRITHLPTNIVVARQDERSQFQNKDKAMRLLKTKLLEAQEEQQRQSSSELRKSQVGSGDRSEKIRTYNFPQNRMTDHRINFTSHSMDQVLGGQLEPVIDALAAAERVEKMKDA